MSNIRYLLVKREKYKLEKGPVSTFRATTDQLGTPGNEKLSFGPMAERQFPYSQTKME